MNIRTFELERIQSLYENTVPINLTESGFHPYSLQELLTPEQQQEILNLSLGYGQTNGSIPLRETIARLYPDTTTDQILVTNGSAEANFIACHSLLSPGDEVIIMVPNYMQIWGIVEEMKCIPKPFHLQADQNWKPDLNALNQAISAKTKMICICNPNNPTGYVLTSKEMEQIIELAATVDAWILCDEVYRGAELDGIPKPSFCGMYPKVVVNGGLSKAYALPGLRIGWLVGPKEIIDQAWAYSDYTSITAGVLSHRIAEIALSEPTRGQILQRNQDLLRTNVQVFAEWHQSFQSLIEYTTPQSGGMVFIRYKFPISSRQLSDRMRKEIGVFIVPGSVYDFESYLRIGIGADTTTLHEGLEKMGQFLRDQFGSTF